MDQAVFFYFSIFAFLQNKTTMQAFKRSRRQLLAGTTASLQIYEHNKQQNLPELFDQVKNRLRDVILLSLR